MRELPPADNPTTVGASWHPILLWVVFALIVCGFCLLNYTGLKNTSARIDDSFQKEKISPEMVLMGRYSIGAKRVYSGFLKQETDTFSSGLLQQLKGSVGGASDQVGLIPFVAELAGQEDVFAYIDALRNSADLTSQLNADLDQFEMLYRFGAKDLSPDNHHRLTKRYRWVAQLALTTGLPENHPDRVLAMKPAMRTFFTALIVFGIITVGGLTGCVLFIISLVLLKKKRVRFAFSLGPTAVPLKSYAFLESATLFLAMTLLLNMVGRYLFTPVVWGLFILVAGVSVCWPIWRGMQWRAMRDAIGWHRGKGLIREMGAGMWGYLAGLPVMACGILATYFIAQYTGANPAHPIVEQFENASMQKMIGMLALACVMAPIVEETIFRGTLYTHLRLKRTALWSALITSLVFAIIHPQGLAALPALGAIAVVFALLREWRGSLIASMTAHAFNNFLAVMVLAFALSG